MKNISILLVSFLFICLVNSQVLSYLEVYTASPNPDLYSPAPLTNITASTAICGNVDTNQGVTCKLFMVNNSATDTFDVVMKRYIIQEVSGSFNVMIYEGTQYLPSMSTTNSMTILPGDTTDIDNVVVEYYPMGNAGQTTILYHFYNELDTNDYISTTVIFNPLNGKEYQTTNTYHLYPNPIFDFLNISIDENNPELMLKISDLQGNILKISTIPAGSKTYTVDLQNFCPSVYLYSIYEGNELKQINKFIKQ